MEFNPSLSIKLLSAVDPGSLILLGDAYGFCIVREGDPSKQRAVILYDGTSFRYEVGVWPPVVDFGKSYTVSPDLATFDSDAAPEPNGTLYFLDGAPTLVLPMESSIALRQSDDGLDGVQVVVAGSQRLPLVAGRGAHRRRTRAADRSGSRRRHIRRG